MNPLTDIPAGSKVRFNEEGKRWWRNFQSRTNFNLTMVVRQATEVSHPHQARTVIVKFQKGLLRDVNNRIFPVAHLELVEDLTES